MHVDYQETGPPLLPKTPTLSLLKRAINQWNMQEVDIQGRLSHLASNQCQGLSGDFVATFKKEFILNRFSQSF